jgi:hypothetical protein
MNHKVTIFLFAFILSCAGGDIKNNTTESKCVSVSPMDNLAPHIGKCIIMKGAVTDTGYSSIVDYWIPVPELEKFRGQKVSLKGTLETRKESSSGSGDQGSTRGVYFIKVISIEPLR